MKHIICVRLHVEPENRVRASCYIMTGIGYSSHQQRKRAGCGVIRLHRDRGLRYKHFNGISEYFMAEIKFLHYIFLALPCFFDRLLEHVALAVYAIKHRINHGIDSLNL